MGDIGRRKLKTDGVDHCRRLHSLAEKSNQYFFKIILPNTLTDQKLRIPIKFAREYGDELSDVANFVVPNGCHWKVGMKKERKQIWFVDGWNEFVQHHSIHDGYFLVFAYRGFSNFCVFIFNTTACEIKYSSNGNNAANSSETRIAQYKVDESKDDLSIKVFHSRILRSCSNSLKDKVCDSSATKRSPLVEQNPGMKKRKRVASPNGRFYNGMRNENVKMEWFLHLTDAKAKEYKGSNRPDQKSCENQMHPKYEGNIEIITNEIFDFTKFCIATKKAINSARNYKPNHPCFMVVLHPCNLQNKVLHVPSKFSRRYLNVAPEYIKLEVSDGRRWAACIKKNDRHFVKGLKAFFDDNNLRPGDVCLFELLKDDKVMKAAIYKADQAAIYEADQEDVEIISSKNLDCVNLSSESQRAMNAARNYKPENPSLIVVLRMLDCHNHRLYIPSKFSRKYLTRHSTLVKLEVYGLEWTVSFRRSNNSYSAFGKGWNTFCEDNYLKPGDVCIFELTANKVLKLKVSIFRAVQETVPAN